jgi:tetratricopeptide (TPR) repeat protein
MASLVKTLRSVTAERLALEALTLLCCLGVFLGGCGPRSGLYPESTLGTAEHHVFNGFALLRMERPDDAQREFELALRIDPKCSGAYRGLGWIEGRKGEFATAFASMGKAKELAEKKQEKALVEAGFMGLYTMQKGPDWVQRVEQSFRAACSLEEDLPEAYFLLGMAYKEVHRYADAERAFKKVVWIHGAFLNEAREELDSIQRILKAGPGSASTPK